jgi:hypothetical protein
MALELLDVLQCTVVQVPCHPSPAAAAANANLDAGAEAVHAALEAAGISGEGLHVCINEDAAFVSWVRKSPQVLPVLVLVVLQLLMLSLLVSLLATMREAAVLQSRERSQCTAVGLFSRRLHTRTLPTSTCINTLMLAPEGGCVFQ